MEDRKIRSENFKCLLSRKCHKLLYQLYAKFPCRVTYQLYEHHLGFIPTLQIHHIFFVEWWKHQATDCHTRFHLDLSLCINLSDISHLGNSLRILLAEPCGSGFRSEEESPGSFSLKLDKSGVRINRVSWTENSRSWFEGGKERTY